jgi:hypothetical protein
MWVMVVRAGAPTPITSPNPDWSGFLRDDSDGVAPEPLVGVFFHTAELKALRKQYGRPDVPEQSPAANIAAMALVGLIETRDDLCRTAARWALTWSLCERWVQYGIANLRGVPLSHGGLAQADITNVGYRYKADGK